MTILVFVVIFLFSGYLGSSRSLAQNKFSFGVKPGMVIQNSYFGFTAGKFLPYGSLDLLWLTVNYKETNSGSSSYDYYGYSYSSTWQEEQETKGKALVLIPHFGTKFYVRGARASEGLRAYLNGDLYFSLPSVSGKEKGHRIYTQDGDVESEYWDEKLDKETTDLIEDALSFWGFNMSFGAEYMVSEHFSVGGEYGFRLWFNKIKSSDEDSYSSGYPPYQQTYQEKWEDELSLTLKMNYAVVALNFYF